MDLIELTSYASLHRKHKDSKQVDLLLVMILSITGVLRPNLRLFAYWCRYNLKSLNTSHIEKQCRKLGHKNNKNQTIGSRRNI